MGEGSKILVTDMDDVLVHISTPWLQRALATARFGSHPALAHLPRDGGDLFGTATARPQYYLQEWIKGLGVEPGLIPFFDEVTSQIAANQVDNGVCERWNSVPAVTEVFSPHCAHIRRPRPVTQNSPTPHPGHENPSGQRSPLRYSRHDTSSGNHSRNS